MLITSESPGAVVPLQEHLARTGTPTTAPNTQGKSTIAGLYGIPDTEKTALLGPLKQELSEKDLVSFDGSDTIASVTQGGLDAFRQKDEASQAHHHGQAIEAIAKKCRESDRVGVVVGHLRCWVGKGVEEVFTRSLPRVNWREEVRIRPGSSLLPLRTACVRDSCCYPQTHIRAWLESCLPVARPDDAFIDSILGRPAKE